MYNSEELQKKNQHIDEKSFAIEAYRKRFGADVVDGCAETIETWYNGFYPVVSPGKVKYFTGWWFVSGTGTCSFYTPNNVTITVTDTKFFFGTMCPFDIPLGMTVHFNGFQVNGAAMDGSGTGGPSIAMSFNFRDFTQVAPANFYQPIGAGYVLTGLTNCSASAADTIDITNSIFRFSMRIPGFSVVDFNDFFSELFNISGCTFTVESAVFSAGSWDVIFIGNLNGATAAVDCNIRIIGSPQSHKWATLEANVCAADIYSYSMPTTAVAILTGDTLFLDAYCEEYAGVGFVADLVDGSIYPIAANGVVGVDTGNDCP